MSERSVALAIGWENTCSPGFVGVAAATGGVLVAHDRLDAATVMAALAAA